MLATLPAGAQRHWTAADGLPTGEVRQIIALPNGQMLVNCEGVFCISNGPGFDQVKCDYGRAYRLSHYAGNYGYLWQGDSLLWLRDFYRAYLFDARTRSFRYDIAARLTTPELRLFIDNDPTLSQQPENVRRMADSLQMQIDCIATDHQGGLWIGTRKDGIFYQPSRSTGACTLNVHSRLIDRARSTTDSQGRVWRCKNIGLEVEQQGRITVYDVGRMKGLPYNRTTFIAPLPDGRYLLCDSLSTLGYFLPADLVFVSLSERLPQLSKYRHFVGACPIDKRWTVVYTQNGAFMLDTQADSIAAFPPADAIERYTEKYNCMLKDRNGQLWVGTQNGLFRLTPTARNANGQYEVTRMTELSNNCIRSLVMDGQGRVWAGTSFGISRVTPSVFNLGADDSVPGTQMMERAAAMTDDGQLVFAISSEKAVMLHPDSIFSDTWGMPVVVTSCSVNNEVVEQPGSNLCLRYDENYVTVQFSMLNYATPSHTRYRYRLKPLQEWVYTSGVQGLGTAVYTALPPGSYTFEVEGEQPTGQWGAGTAMSVSIAPPLWLTWWAKTLYVLIGLAVVVAAVAFYLKKRREKLERENDERVNRLFELRDEARHRFVQTVNIEPGKITASKEEEELVEKLLKVIGDNIDDIDYTVDQMARDVAMSRASLYKKMSLMLGITPNEFLRNVRLKHAAQLLTTTQTPVNQVSLMVGFQSSRYFSQCFKQLFGVTPSEYREGNDHQ
jgi:AraC-like DNA-binding protein